MPQTTQLDILKSAQKSNSYLSYRSALLRTGLSAKVLTDYENNYTKESMKRPLKVYRKTIELMLNKGIYNSNVDFLNQAAAEVNEVLYLPTINIRNTLQTNKLSNQMSEQILINKAEQQSQHVQLQSVKPNTVTDTSITQQSQSQQQSQLEQIQIQDQLETIQKQVPSTQPVVSQPTHTQPAHQTSQVQPELQPHDIFTSEQPVDIASLLGSRSGTTHTTNSAVSEIEDKFVETLYNDGTFYSQAINNGQSQQQPVQQTQQSQHVNSQRKSVPSIEDIVNSSQNNQDNRSTTEKIQYSQTQNQELHNVESNGNQRQIKQSVDTQITQLVGTDDISGDILDSSNQNIQLDKPEENQLVQVSNDKINSDKSVVISMSEKPLDEIIIGILNSSDDSFVLSSDTLISPKTNSVCKSETINTLGNILNNLNSDVVETSFNAADNTHVTPTNQSISPDNQSDTQRLTIIKPARTAKSARSRRVMMVRVDEENDYYGYEENDSDKLSDTLDDITSTDDNTHTDNIFTHQHDSDSEPDTTTKITQSDNPESSNQSNIITDDEVTPIEELLNESGVVGSLLKESMNDQRYDDTSDNLQSSIQHNISKVELDDDTRKQVEVTKSSVENKGQSIKIKTKRLKAVRLTNKNLTSQSGVSQPVQEEELQVEELKTEEQESGQEQQVQHGVVYKQTDKPAPVQAPPITLVNPEYLKETLPDVEETLKSSFISRVDGVHVPTLTEMLVAVVADVLIVSVLGFIGIGYILPMFVDIPKKAVPIIVGALIVITGITVVTGFFVKYWSMMKLEKDRFTIKDSTTFEMEELARRDRVNIGDIFKSKKIILKELDELNCDLEEYEEDNTVN